MKIMIIVSLWVSFSVGFLAMLAGLQTVNQGAIRSRQDRWNFESAARGVLYYDSFHETADAV